MEVARKTRPLKPGKDFAVARLLARIVQGKALLNLEKGAKLFHQGEEADAIYLVETGTVRLTVVSKQGKKAVLGMMGPRDFLGGECLVENSRRTSTATCLETSTVFQIEKRTMLRAIHLQPRLSEEFVASLLTRNINMEKDLCDQLFNHSELRLACTLLKLARSGHRTKLGVIKVPAVGYEKLAHIVGTTPSKIIFFMNKFRKLGLIDYEGEGDIRVMSEPLTDMVLA